MPHLRHNEEVSTTSLTTVSGLINPQWELSLTHLFIPTRQFNNETLIKSWANLPLRSLVKYMGQVIHRFWRIKHSRSLTKEVIRHIFGKCYNFCFLFSLHCSRSGRVRVCFVILSVSVPNYQRVYLNIKSSRKSTNSLTRSKLNTPPPTHRPHPPNGKRKWADYSKFANKKINLCKTCS